MMSLESIIAQSRQQGKEAESQELEPCQFDQFELEHLKDGNNTYLGSIPFLGTFRPSGWEPVDLETEPVESNHAIYLGDNKGFGAYMVDSSGLGTPGEAALTIGQFVETLSLKYGYGIVEAGQFQIKIGLFKKTA